MPVQSVDFHHDSAVDLDPEYLTFNGPHPAFLFNDSKNKKREQNSSAIASKRHQALIITTCAGSHRAGGASQMI